MNLLEGRKYNIITFGCQMNEHDSETISGMLQEKGCREVLTKEESDITVINTCSIRENADKRFFGTLGQLKKIKEKNPQYIACVCGCMMQQQHIIDTVKKKYPWVDIIFGTHNIDRFPQLLEKVACEKQKIFEIMEDRQDIVENLPAKRLFRHKAFVNIMYGCNNFCTYCIVPYTRGREKNRHPEDILDEVRGLVGDGVNEVTLLGQNVNSYRGRGKKAEDTDTVCDFADLIYMLNDVEGLERIRFMTSHPKDLSDKLIQAYVDCDKLCNYIHLPVQSGSDSILQAMNRKYSREHYLELVRKLTEAVPGITVSTDIIVGFPGETEADFEETLSLVKQVKYDSAFTFLYSIRKGTPAAEYDDQIPESIKHERFNRLVDAVNEASAHNNAAYVGRIEKVLVDGRSKRKDNTLTGRTEGFKLVDFPGDDSLIGQIVNIEITEGKTFSLFGKVVQRHAAF
ncbi:MAG: tRNA (N6-isopentenyl adenosine(37)-C2)-methylthiotransferase MiaB [Clostridiales bacterium]|nr:tRNA (N6-isopentenyl adenosine(37)-C2)-methylthiotransferase MiaB [Clostridiales bacterium]